MAFSEKEFDIFVAKKVKETLQYHWDATRISPTPTGQEALDAKLAVLGHARFVTMRSFVKEESELRRMRNSWAPLHRLPVETFITILLLVVEDHSTDGDDEPIQLHRLASVCSHWRTVLLNCAGFWKALSPQFGTHFQRWTLRRNPNGLLRIYYIPQQSMSQNARVEFLDLVIQDSARWQKLVFQDILDEDMCAILRRDMPRLTDLFVNNSPWSPHLPSPELFLSEGVTLRYLSLTNAAVSWNSPRLRNLRALDLSRINQSLPSLHQLHAILSSSPQLWCLILSELTMEPTWDGELPQREVHLPNLTTLILRYTPDSVTQLVLSTVTAPACNFVILSGLQLQHIRNSPSKLQALLRLPLQTRPPIQFRGWTTGSRNGSLNLCSIPIPEVPSEWLYHVTERVGIDLKFDLPGWDEDAIEDVTKWVAASVSAFQWPEDLILAFDGWNQPMQLLFGCPQFDQTAVRRLRLLSEDTATYVLGWLADCPVRAGDREVPEHGKGLRFPLLAAVYLDCPAYDIPFLPLIKQFVESRVGPEGKPFPSTNISPGLTIGVPDMWIDVVKDSLAGCSVGVTQIPDPMQSGFEF
ncbi:hypothetical protein FRC04_012143 [Tulasnella sp. 424]|nr:hypothetical protein FRC04_012143 [Tulasnella sp. 424]KAG8971049.1 hypothetical protein FRC05_011515 [Tulasnella sp. 425]